MTQVNNNIVIEGINGPVVTVKNCDILHMQEMVYVGNEKLIGEVIGIRPDLTIIQVYEVTTGLKIGEPVIPTGHPMAATLGPGILTNIYDGIERPLKIFEDTSGAFIQRGLNIGALDEEKLWDVTIKVKVGDYVKGGDIYATCPETTLIEHRCLVAPYQSGEVIEVKPDGKYKVNDVVVVIKNIRGEREELTLCQVWPIRDPRPFTERKPIDTPLVTGQRIVDALFPIAKGGASAIPGPFGSGKTVMQHQLAKWCDADIIVYIGCGERGNEMTQVLQEFAELIDPKSGRPLMDRTVLIANTSNMPVSAREASIYTGITLAEYYRDMGYHVAIMADSTSRWAEALRELSGRLEEMPAEEGFPAYLPSRLSQFYERSGYTIGLNGREGSVSIIGAVSPAGGDFSEPVTQNTKRFIRCFWALDKDLAYARHYPAINWLNSYSEYIVDLEKWYTEHVGPKFNQFRKETSVILQEENNLMEIVKLIGSDVLPDDQKLILEIARLIRVGFLQQNSFHEVDTYVPLEKQSKMLEVILHLYKRGKEIVSKGVPMSVVRKCPVFDKIVNIKYDVSNSDFSIIDQYIKDIDVYADNIIEEYNN